MESGRPSVENTLISVMSYISRNTPIPVAVAKQLVVRMILFRAESQWLQDIIEGYLKDSSDAASKVNGLMSRVAGTFESKDTLFLNAYLACSGKMIKDESGKIGRSFTLVRGGKDDE